jgi:DNA repair exonuclease SbcCD ATPase subunit
VEFTAARNRQAATLKAGGDADGAKAVKALKKPSLPAWAVNVLAHERGPEVSRLVELGAQLREAQERLSGDDLKGLNRDRQRVVAGLVAETRRLAGERGHPLNEGAARQVEQTLAAALADPGAGAAVASGRLVKPLEYAGLGPVDVAGAVAAPAPAAPVGPSKSKPAAKESAELKRVRRDLAAAEQALGQAESKLQSAETAHRQAEASAVTAETEVDRLEGEVAQARKEAARARDQAGRMATAEQEVRKAAEDGRDRVRTLKDRLDHLAAK